MRAWATSNPHDQNWQRRPRPSKIGKQRFGLCSLAQGELAYEMNQLEGARASSRAAAVTATGSLPDAANVESLAHVGVLDAVAGQSVSGRGAVQSCLEYARKMGRMLLEARCRVFAAPSTSRQEGFQKRWRHSLPFQTTTRNARLARNCVHRCTIGACVPCLDWVMKGRHGPRTTLPVDSLVLCGRRYQRSSERSSTPGQRSDESPASVRMMVHSR